MSENTERAERSCACYPDAARPEPCPRKYALGECRAAAGLPDLFPPGGTSAFFAEVEQAEAEKHVCGKTCVCLTQCGDYYASHGLPEPKTE